MKKNGVYDLDQAVFTYLLSETEDERFQQHTSVLGDKYVLSYTSQTDVRQAICGALEVVVVGLCVDAYGELERDDVPQFLLDSLSGSVENMIQTTNRLAGKYVILFRTSHDIYIIGDATSSMQVNYAFQDEHVCLSSVDHLIATRNGYEISEYSKEIRLGAELSQPLPNDITMYDEVKVLLPNHYLDVGKKECKRFKLLVPSKLSIQECLEKSLRWSKNALHQYNKYYDLVCPLTSGDDSRIVFAMMKEEVDPLQCYTFYHKGFDEHTSDIVVPQNICKDYGIPHRIIPDLQESEEYTQELEAYIGKFHSRHTVDLAATFKSSFHGRAIINGDIIGHNGKDYLAHGIPNSFISRGFIKCKIHNTRPNSNREIQNYITRIRDDRNVSDIDVIDLFSIENRCGRWAAQGNMIYNMCGIDCLNIFNCRDIILLWLNIPRKLRSKKVVHRYFLKNTDGRLLNYPNNPPVTAKEKIIDRLSQYWPSYLLMTYVKQMMLKLKR